MVEAEIGESNAKLTANGGNCGLQGEGQPPGSHHRHNATNDGLRLPSSRGHRECCQGTVSPPPPVRHRSNNRRTPESPRQNQRPSVPEAADADFVAPADNGHHDR